MTIALTLMTALVLILFTFCLAIIGKGVEDRKDRDFYLQQWTKSEEWVKLLMELAKGKESTND